MKKILTGIKPTGPIHLGNYFGSIKSLIDSQNEYLSYLFIADLHALTSVKTPQSLKENITNIIIKLYALGVDSDNITFYLQSKHSEIASLSWIFDCIMPLNRLMLGHAYKAAVGSVKPENLNVGILTYPTLMAADILIINPDVVPVGKDQLQHLQITRDIAKKFNSIYGEYFKLPEALMSNYEILPGTDGKKMSKSHGNIIDMFLPENILLSQIKSIKTDSTPVDQPKKPETVYKLLETVATEAEMDHVTDKYLNGGMGYGAAKELLFECIIRYFKDAREKYFSAKLESVTDKWREHPINKKLMMDSFVVTGDIHNNFHEVLERIGLK